MRAFVTDQEDYERNPVEVITTTLFTISIKEIEKDMFLCLVMSHENLYSDNCEEHTDVSISNYSQEASMFREEDTSIVKQTLELYYDLYRLFHPPMTEMYQKDLGMFRNLMTEFTTNFDRHFFHTE